MIDTNAENVKSAFKRLSAAALSGIDANCTVSKDDLATLLLAYRLELGNSSNNALILTKGHQR